MSTWNWSRPISPAWCADPISSWSATRRSTGRTAMAGCSGHGLPQDVEVDVEVVVHQAISSSRSIGPRYGWVHGSSSWRHLLGRLTDDLHELRQRERQHLIRVEVVTRTASSKRDSLARCVVQMAQASGVVRLHREPASPSAPHRGSND